MFELRWLLRAKRWAARPPSAQRVKLVLGIIAVVLLIGGVEHFIGWPDWMSVEATGRNSIAR